MRAAR